MPCVDNLSVTYPHSEYIYILSDVIKNAPFRFYNGGLVENVIYVEVSDQINHVYTRSFGYDKDKRNIFDLIESMKLLPGKYLVDYAKKVIISDIQQEKLNADFWSTYPKKHTNEGAFLIYSDATKRYFRMFGKDGESSLLYLLRVMNYLDLDIPETGDMIGIRTLLNMMCKYYGLPPINFTGKSLFPDHFPKVLCEWLGKVKRRDKLLHIKESNCSELKEVVKLVTTKKPEEQLKLLPDKIRDLDDELLEYLGEDDDEEDFEILYLSDILQDGKVPESEIPIQVVDDIKIDGVLEIFCQHKKLHVYVHSGIKNTADIINSLSDFDIVICRKVDEVKEE